jgi:putative protease
VVLARELSLMQVADITRDIKRQQIKGPSGSLVRIELFAHGALCMAVSGKCYLSLHSDYASANRGACIQNCRKSYIVTEKENGTEFEVDNEYIMSAKDLCTIEFMDKILDAEVTILKIEGRGRSADYVHTVVSCYREAIDSYTNGTYGPELFEGWKSRLSTVFNRGFWDGYYLGRKMGEWSNEYGSKATRKKVYIGRGIKYFDKVGAAEFMMDSHSLTKGTEVMITGPTTGIIRTTVTEMRVDDKIQETVRKGDAFSILLADKIRPSDKLYKMEDS